MLSFAITHSKTSPIAGIVCALFNGILFLVGYPIINLFPRFLLGGLVFFAGLGFVVENLVDTLTGPTKFRRSNYFIVLLILATTIVSEMVYGVLVGVTISLILYMLGGISCRAVSDVEIEQKHALLRLSETENIKTKVIRPQVDTTKLRGLEDLVIVAAVAKYLFFGSLCELQIAISNWLEEREHRMPPCRRARYLVLDLTEIGSLDQRLTSRTAMEQLVSIVKQVHAHGVITVLSGMDPFDPGNPCHRIAAIAMIDPDVRWIWCGDLGCDATLEARYFAHQAASLDAIRSAEIGAGAEEGAVLTDQDVTTAAVRPTAREMGEAAVAALKQGPTKRDRISVTDGHMGVLPTRESENTHRGAHAHTGVELRAFASVEEAIEFVEDELLRWAMQVRKRWERLDPSFETHHAQAVGRARHSEQHPIFDVSRMQGCGVEVVTYEAGSLISRQGARDERPSACIAASGRAGKYVCTCGLTNAAECAKADHTPFLFNVLSGRVKATKKETHGQVAHSVKAWSIRCGNPQCKCALHRAKVRMTEQLSALVEAEQDARALRESVLELTPSATERAIAAERALLCEAVRNIDLQLQQYATRQECRDRDTRAKQIASLKAVGKTRQNMGNRRRSALNALCLQLDTLERGERETLDETHLLSARMPPQCFNEARAADDAGFNPEGWMVEALVSKQKYKSKKWTRARILSFTTPSTPLEKLRSKSSSLTSQVKDAVHRYRAVPFWMEKGDDDRMYQVEQEPVAKYVCTLTHGIYGNIGAMWGAMRPEYTLRAMESTVVVKYPRYVLADMAKNDATLALELNAKVLRNLWWRESNLNTSHERNVFFHSPEHADAAIVHRDDALEMDRHELRSAFAVIARSEKDDEKSNTSVCARDIVKRSADIARAQKRFDLYIPLSEAEEMVYEAQLNAESAAWQAASMVREGEEEDEHDMRGSTRIREVEALILEAKSREHAIGALVRVDGMKKFDTAGTNGRLTRKYNGRVGRIVAESLGGTQLSVELFDGEGDPFLKYYMAKETQPVAARGTKLIKVMKHHLRPYPAVLTLAEVVHALECVYENERTDASSEREASEREEETQRRRAESERDDGYCRPGGTILSLSLAAPAVFQIPNTESPTEHSRTFDGAATGSGSGTSTPAMSTFTRTSTLNPLPPGQNNDSLDL